MTRLPDFIEGVVQDAWWVRARHMHSIPVCDLCFLRAVIHLTDGLHRASLRIIKES